MRTNRFIHTKWGRNLCICAILVVLSYFSDRSEAAEQLQNPADSGIWHTVSDRTLDQLRGGFDVGGGLLVSFGITRTVYINGALITETSLNVGDLAKLTPAQALQLNGQLHGLNLVQNGPGNTVPANLANIGAGTIIQNTLNNQQINVQTMINASSNGLGMVRSMNAQGTINDALTRAAMPH
ncbi:hypothetical protein [Rhodoferax sp.]|uniref:hypothetical protein n=1 Tax=Rhodoferax sp. TaxID=50421 RepID=UPI0025E0D8C3|nr:hypothetical protein [Rhodoferax sp.]